MAIFFNTWGDFAKIAKNIDYLTGYCDEAEINEDLVIVFSDESWLERQVTDFSEQFKFVKKPTIQADAKILEQWHIY